MNQKNKAIVDSLRRLQKDGEISLYTANAYIEKVNGDDIEELREDIKERVSLERITKNTAFRELGVLLGVC